MIEELEKVQAKEKGKFVATFSTNWYRLVSDVIDKLKELLEKNQRLEQDSLTLKAIEYAEEKGMRYRKHHNDGWEVMIVITDGIWKWISLISWYEKEVLNE